MNQKRRGNTKFHFRIKILLKYNIERASYHGGDLTGKNILCLFNNAEDVFQSFRTVLIQRNKPGGISNLIITVRCKKTEELCILLDYMFSLARTPCGDLTPAIIVTTKECIKAVVRKWKDLRLSLNGPKWHAIEDHLIYLMEYWNGIGCFTEDHVEKSHQTGMLEEKRTGHMLNRERAAKTHSNNEWMRNMEPTVQLEIKRVSTETKRTRGKRGRDEMSLKQKSASDKQIERKRRRTAALTNVSMEVDLVDNDDLEDHVIVDVDDDDDDDDNDDGDDVTDNMWV